MTEVEAEDRRPGRPRRVEVDMSILSAATELFAEVGYDGLCVDDLVDSVLVAFSA